MNPIEQLIAVYPKCRICGADWVADSEQEAIDCLYADSELRASIPKNDLVTYDKIHTIAWVCQRCQFMTQSQRLESERRYRQCKLVEDTFGYGKMPRCAMLQNFTQSSSDCESQNIDCWQKARAWRNDCSLWIQGTKGTGKTFMSRCLLNWALDQGHSVIEVSSVDFCEWVYRQGEKQRREAESIDVLLFDDIDKPEWRIDSIIALWKLLDKRSSDKRNTIMTSNVSPSVLKSRWQEVEGPNRAVVEPMIDRMHGFQRITLEGKSLR